MRNIIPKDHASVLNETLSFSITSGAAKIGSKYLISSDVTTEPLSKSPYSPILKRLIVFVNLKMRIILVEILQ